MPAPRPNTTPAPALESRLLVLAERARLLAAFLDDEDKAALAIAARNLAREIGAVANRRSHLRRVA